MKILNHNSSSVEIKSHFKALEKKIQRLISENRSLEILVSLSI